jgi:peptidoglycan/xylan/chitin deacetylase (PgdA/CDA1 family)
MVPLSSVLDNLASVAITFDDGYRNFLRVALPVLKE